MNTAAPYQVIARKYRPQTFSSVVGQEPIVTTLKNALRFQRLAHAYLFCGCRGTGKTTLARIFAKALNCQHPTEEGEPCNTCPSCLDITSGHSLDVLEIDGASNRGIDDIRQINETVGYAPTLGQYKIYIIDEVHMLTKEAFNALLKTLEEPPSHVKFFFATTEPHKILPTILSRCQRFDLSRISFEVLVDKLRWIVQDLQVTCEEDVLTYIASLAEGSLRDAESLLDQVICYAQPPLTLSKVSTALGIVPKSIFFALDQAFVEQNLSYAFELAADLFSSGKDLSCFWEQLLEHFRTLLKLKLDPRRPPPSSKLQQQYLSSASCYTEEQIFYILDFLIQTQQQFNKTPFKRVHLEMGLMHLIRSKHRITLPALVRRLQELESQVASSPQKNSSAENNGPDLSLLQTSKEAINPACVPPMDEENPCVTPSVSSTHNEAHALESPSSLACLERPAPIQVTPLSPPLQHSEQKGGSSVDDLLIEKIQKKLTSSVSEPSSLLLSKEEWTSKSSPQEESSAQENPPSQEVSQPPSPQGCHYDTLVRFAAVELEGIIKNLTK